MEKFTTFDFKNPQGKSYSHPLHEGSSSLEWLEQYCFYRSKGKNPKYTVYLQSGWGRNEGGGCEDPLPKEWFKGSWDEFLTKYIAKYKPEDFFITREELENWPGLKEFLGF